MFIKIVYAAEDEEKELLVNPNCSIRIIYDYIKNKVKIPDECEIDLCDENGELKNINKLPSWTNATELLPSRQRYYVIRYDTKEDGSVILYPMVKSGTSLFNELSAIVNKTLPNNKTSGSKRKSKRGSLL